MKLLDPNEIRKEKSESNEEAQLRTRKLANEESKLVRQINLARENAKKEIEKIDAGVDEHRKKTEHEKAILSSEIEGLKEQKRKLLLPIDEIRKEAEKVLQEAEKIRAEAKTALENSQTDREKNQDDAEDNRDRSDELDQREAGIAEKEKGIEKENVKRKALADKLADDWVIYHKAVAILNAKIKENTKREAEISSREKAVAAREEDQAKITKSQNEKDRELKSNYAALSSAKQEIIKKRHDDSKQNNSNSGDAR